MIFVDANLFLRALVRPTNQETQYLQEVASELLRKADRGDIEFTTSDAVLAEVAFILTAKTHYNIPISDAIGLLATIFRLRGFRHRNKSTLLRSLEIWEDYPRIGFVDALTAAYAQSPGMVLATFDSDFDRLSGIERWTPDNHQ